MQIPFFPHDIFPDAMPAEGLIGGLMIGCAAALMLLGSGRIAGISGITARALMLTKSSAPVASAWLFIGGILAGTVLVGALVGPIEARFAPSYLLLGIGGVIVGFGTRLGSGCTSGHGVCGMSRLSPRSLAATAIFMASAMLTVFIANHLGWSW